MRREKLVLLGLAASVAVGTAGLTWGYYRLLPSGQALPGTFVGDRVPPRDVALGDWLEQQRVALGSREAYLELPDGDGNVKTTFARLGIDLDVAKTLERARERAREGALPARLARALRARRGEEQIELVWSLHPERAKLTLEQIAPQVWRDAIDARLDLVLHDKIVEQPGRTLDVEATLQLIAEGEREEPRVIPIAVKPVRAQVTTEMLGAVDITRVLGAFESKFGGTGRGRGVNIAKGAEYLNGTVIAPGQVVSFNEIVGPRRLERGFTWAPEIKDDEMEPGVGGGTCQVASTLHAAAVYGGVEIVERRSHSRPSGYVPMGLDATVVFGEVDLKLKNPFAVPLIIHAVLPTPTTLRVELLGRDAPGKITHTYGVMRSYDFYRRVWTKDWLSPEKSIKRQRGIRGYDVVSIVKLEHPDGRVDQRQYFSWYRPVPEVFWVGPGYDLAALPELPEGAERVEVDGRPEAEQPTGPLAVENPRDPYERAATDPG